MSGAVIPFLNPILKKNSPDISDCIYVTDNAWTGWTLNNINATASGDGVATIVCNSTAGTYDKSLSIPINKNKVWLRAKVTSGSLFGWGLATASGATYPTVDLYFPALNTWVEFECELRLEAGSGTKVSLTQGSAFVAAGNTLQVSGLSVGSYNYSPRVLTDSGCAAANQASILIQKVVAPTGGDFSTIAAAINGCTDVGPHRQYELLIKPGTYAETNITPLDYIHLTGEDPATCIIAAHISPSSSVANIAAQSTMMLTHNSRVKNLTITIQNGRYAVHMDDTPNFNKLSQFINCYIEHLGNDEARADPAHSGDYSSIWTSEYAVGVGTRTGEAITAENCTFKGPAGAFSTHNSSNFIRPCSVYLKNCKLIGTKEGAFSFRMQSLGSGKLDQATLENCEMNGDIIHNDSGWAGGTPATRIEWQLSLINCTPVLYNVSTSVSADQYTRPLNLTNEIELFNTSGVLIPRGSAVVYNTARSNIRAMATSDAVARYIGIALTDIAISARGRVSKSGIDTSTFIARDGADSVSMGTALGISTVTPGQFKVGATPTVIYGIGSEVVKY